MSGARRRRVLAVAGGVVVAVAIAEIGLRTVGGVFHDDVTQLDAVRGWTLRPNAAGWTGDENTLPIAINSDGLRDREYAREAGHDTFRVAVLGDSYMEARNVPLEKTFDAVLEGELNGCMRGTRRKAESINFGVSGYGTAQQLLTYRHHARHYRPDVVVLAFYTGNDVFNNHFDLNPVESRELSPYFTLNGDELVLDQSFQEAVAGGARDRQPWWRRLRMWVTDRSRAAQLLHVAWGGLRRLRDEGDAGGQREVEIDETDIYRPPSTAETLDAWRVTEAVIRQLAEEVRADDAAFWIVTLTTAEQVTPDLDRRAALASTLGVPSLLYPDDRIRALADRHQIRVVTLAPVFADYSARHGVDFHGGYNDDYPAGTGHWNETAHAMGARIVAERLCEEAAERR